MSAAKGRLLVVDDDQRLRELLKRYLTENGYAVQGVAGGKEMDRVRERELFDLIVLDLMLPDEDGLAICRRLRARGDAVPVIMLTAKGDEVDRIVGLEMGADDYLAKPFNPRELLARIQAVLRRQAPRAMPGAPTPQAAVVEFGPFVLDLGTRQLLRAGDRVNLTTGEFALLRVLVERPREPLSRQKLLELSRGREHEPFDRTIDVQMSRLRRIIEDDPAHPRYLQTVWGLGYMFVPDGVAP